VAAADNLTGYSFDTPRTDGVVEQRYPAVFRALGAVPSADPVTAYARQVQTNAGALSEDLALAGTAPATPSGAAYPAEGSSIRDRLQSLAKLLHVTTPGGSLPVRAVTLNASGGYDTHSGQATPVADGLRRNAQSLRAFFRDLALRGLDDRVVVLLWTEFGRRPEENGSAGTDHGAAGTAFVIGKHVRQGLIGEFPGLAPYSAGSAASGLDRNGNLRHTADYRGLYRGLLEQWFLESADGIIPAAASFPPPALIA